MATKPNPTMATAEHELFPAEGEQAAPAVNMIHVTRFEGGGQEWCQHLFEAEELPNLEALFAGFGGGNYELIGRFKTATSNAITARRRIRLQGPSRPLNGGAEPAAVPPAASVAVPAAGMGGEAGLFGFLAAMMNAQAQQTAAMMSGMFQAIATIATGQNRGGGAADAALAQAVSALATAASAPREGSTEAFVKGTELAAALAESAKPAAGKSDSDDLASVASSIATIAGAVGGGKQAGAESRASGGGAPPGMQGGPPANAA